MADVFISYKSERRAAAEHLAEVLTDHGYSVWWDYGLISGRDFGRQIESELRAAKAVIVLWCSLAVESDWVREEATLAKTLNKIIPTKIEQIDLPLGFSLAQTLDLSAWDGAPQSPKLDRLVRDIGHFVGRAPAPNYDGLERTERAWRRFGAPPLREFALIDALEPKTTRTLPSTLTPPRAAPPPPPPAAPAPVAQPEPVHVAPPPTPKPAPNPAPPPAGPQPGWVKQVILATPIVWGLRLLVVFVVALMVEPGRDPGQQFENMFMDTDAIAPLSIIALAVIGTLGLRYILARKMKDWTPVGHTLASVAPAAAAFLFMFVTHPPSASEAVRVFFGISACLIAFGALVHFIPAKLAAADAPSPAKG